jgi:hypothetical protein
MVTDTAFNRNGPGDTVERLDFAKMAEVVQGGACLPGGVASAVTASCRAKAVIP